MTKPMVIIEPAVPRKTKMAARSGIFGLGSRLYPGNMQRIFNKDLTRFMQSLSRERQNRASKRKALLAGCLYRNHSANWSPPISSRLSPIPPAEHRQNRVYGNFWSSQKTNNLQKPYEKLATKANTVKKVSIAALVTSIHRIVTRKVHLPRENIFTQLLHHFKFLEKHQNSSKIVTKSLSFKRRPNFF